jgi:hypothetical protein
MVFYLHLWGTVFRQWQVWKHAVNNVLYILKDQFTVKIWYYRNWSAFMNILESKMSSYSHGFATALFSFLYHLASYEAGNIKSSSSFNNVFAKTCFLNKELEWQLWFYVAGGESLVSCGLMESLLKVIEWPGEEDCITVRNVKLFQWNIMHENEAWHSRSFRTLGTIPRQSRQQTTAQKPSIPGQNKNYFLHPNTCIFQWCW